MRSFSFNFIRIGLKMIISKAILIKNIAKTSLALPIVSNIKSKRKIDICDPEPKDNKNLCSGEYWSDVLTCLDFCL